MKRAVQIGWHSARANLIPAVVLWLMAASAVWAYYRLPGVSRAFDEFVGFQNRWGWPVVFGLRAFFCGALPGVFLLTLKSIRPKRPLTVVVIQILWCGAWGVVCDWFYGVQDILFGSGYDAVTVLAKTFVDQFPWTILVISPVNSAFYFWMGRDFSLKRLREDWPHGAFFRNVMLPNLIANWCVWIPVTVAVFLFPAPLRVHVSGFVSAFWFLLCLQVGARSNSAESIDI